MRLRLHEADLNEIDPARPQLKRHAAEMARELLGREVKQRVDRGDGAVELPAEMEINHVGDVEIGIGTEASPRELDHPR